MLPFTHEQVPEKKNYILYEDSSFFRSDTNFKLFFGCPGLVDTKLDNFIKMRVSHLKFLQGKRNIEALLTSKQTIRIGREYFSFFL